MTNSDERVRPTWRHRQGCRYVPVFGDWFGNPTDGYTHEWARLDHREFMSRREAERVGFGRQESDDFNIAVLRNGRVIALLWMTENMQEEQGVLDDLTRLLW